MLYQLLPDNVVYAAGWTILHSLWQGALITLLLVLVFRQTPDKPPATRYQWAVGALFFLPIAALLTFFCYYEPALGMATDFSGLKAMESAQSGTVMLVSAGPVDRLTGIFPALLQAWVLGVAVLALRMLIEWGCLQRLRYANTQAVDADWMDKLQQLSRQLNMRQNVDMRESLRVDGPMLIGFIKPLILLPVGMLANLSPRQVECILVHELAHVRRMDYLVNMVQSAVEVLLFFNPAVWWISTQIREEREHCCDQLALDYTGDKMTLVKTLASLEEWRLQERQLSLAFTGGPKGVLGRVQRLLTGRSSVLVTSRGLWCFLLFSLSISLMSFQNPLTEITDPEPEEEPIDSTYEYKPKVTSVETETPPEKEIIEKVVATETVRYHVARPDTLPVEDLQEQMKALQEEMSELQNEVSNSPERERLRELMEKYHREMDEKREHLMDERADYREAMEIQMRIAQEMEKKHQQLMESDAFRSINIERKKILKEFDREIDELNTAYRDQPRVLEQKMDSIHQEMDRWHQEFERKHYDSILKIAEEMEEWENSQEMKEMRRRLEDFEAEMSELEKMTIEPLEKEMFNLEQQLEDRFQRKMQVLAEKMEKLEKQLYEVQRKNRQ